MRTRTLIFALVTVVLAGLTVFLVRALLNQQSTPVEQVAQQPKAPEEIQVLVAKDNLNSGLLLQQSHMEWQVWPTDSLSPSYVSYIPEDETTDAKEVKELDLVGAVVRFGVPAGQPLVSGAIVKPGERGFLAAILEPGYRAISIPISPSSSNAGLVLPGDRVDIILTHSFTVEQMDGENSKHSASETILTNVRILAIDRNLSNNTEESNVGRTATLQVTPRQAEAMTLAQQIGQLSLSLRGIDDNDSTANLRRTSTWDYQTSLIIQPPGAKAGEVDTPDVVRGGQKSNKK